MAHGDDDVPPLVSTSDVPVGLGSLLQGIAPVDDGRDLSGLDQCLEEGQISSGFGCDSFLCADKGPLGSQCFAAVGT
jgi:hypothetical protein